MTTRHTLVDRGDPSAWDFQQTDLTMDGSWHDLDLSSIVPSGATFVYLYIYVQDSSSNYMTVKKKGNTYDYAGPVIHIQSTSYANDLHCFVACDSSRTIQYKCGSAFNSINILVLGWMIPFTETKLVEIPKNVSPALDDVVYTTNGSSDKKVEIADVNMGQVLLEEQTVSGVASIDMENWHSSHYDEYMVELIGVVVVTSGANIRIRLSTDGGSSYDSGSNYDGSYDYWYDGGENRGASGTTEGYITQGTTGITNSSYTSVNGNFRLFLVNSVSLYKMIQGNVSHISTGGSYVIDGFVIQYQSTSVVNAFQIYCSTGNISGTVRVYGMRRTYTTTTTTT